MGQEPKPRRIAVLGGGLGSLATLFDLTATPGWQDDYDITLYQQGWRLGGKCASGRDSAAGHGQRILEHGLHLFGGFYNYSFAMLDRAYTELARPPGTPNRTVWDAFTGIDGITLMDRVVDADGGVNFDPWRLNFQVAPGLPGDDLEPPGASEMIAGIVRLVGSLTPGVGGLASVPASSNPLLDAIDHTLTLVGGGVLGFVGDVAGDIIGALEAHDATVVDNASAADPKAIERIRMGIFLVQTIVQGLIADDVLTDGFDPLDRFELRDWIRGHAETVAVAFKAWIGDPLAAAEALADWCVVRSSYDYVFGYTDADTSRPAQGAGTALRGLMRLAVGYRGHLFYAMRGGMGEAVIAPLYEVLAQRGVKFAFFSRVERLTPAGGGIDAIEMSTQATVGPGGYDPLIQVALPGWPAGATLPAWPDQPLWDQLAPGEKARLAGQDLEAPWSSVLATRTLKRGQDFDAVVLGISVGELRRICADLPAENPAWGSMLSALTTTRTVGVQLWMQRTNEDLGCSAPGRVQVGNEQPLSCWADLSHLLAREPWDGPERPLSIAYLCGQLPGDAAENAGEAAAATAAALEAARSWLKTEGAAQWPAAADPASSFGIDPMVLHDPDDGSGEARFLAQYFRANTSPSELYVQYPPNSLQARMRADGSGFDNLFLCGDWTRNGLNAGAAEAAVMSGAICARALAGDPTPIPGELDAILT